MKSPLFSEGLGVSDSTAGDLSPCEAGAPPGSFSSLIFDGGFRIPERADM